MMLKISKSMHNNVKVEIEVGIFFVKQTNIVISTLTLNILVIYIGYDQRLV